MALPWRRSNAMPNQVQSSKEPQIYPESLHLKRPPIAENGSAFAADFHDSVLEIEDLDLDYSVESLAFIDTLLQGFHDEGLTVADFAETVFDAGCYVGEVMCRQAGGRWIDRDSLGPTVAPMFAFPMLVELQGGSHANPIGKAYKRFADPTHDSVAYFYQAMVQQDAHRTEPGIG